MTFEIPKYCTKKHGFSCIRKMCFNSMFVYAWWSLKIDDVISKWMPLAVFPYKSILNKCQYITDPGQIGKIYPLILAHFRSYIHMYISLNSCK